MDTVSLDAELESPFGLEEFTLLAELLTNVDDDEEDDPAAQMLGLQSELQCSATGCW
jgi:hypothetical protein